MQELMKNEKTMSSLEIAKLTGKTPGNINRDIKILCEQLGYSNLNSEQNQGVTFVYNERNQIKEILLDKDHALTLVTGYDAKIRMSINRRWQELESKQQFNIPKTLSEALLLAGNLAAENEKLTLQIEEQVEIIEHKDFKIESDKPKVEFAEAVKNLDKACTVAAFAKVLGTGQNRLFQWLRENKYLMANNLPYQQYLDSNLLKVI